MKHGSAGAMDLVASWTGTGQLGFAEVPAAWLQIGLHIHDARHNSSPLPTFRTLMKLEPCPLFLVQTSIYTLGDRVELAFEKLPQMPFVRI